MDECNGAEILPELCEHLRFDPEIYKQPTAFLAECIISPVCSCAACVAIDYKIPAVTQHAKSLHVQFNDLIKAFK